MVTSSHSVQASGHRVKARFLAVEYLPRFNPAGDKRAHSSHCRPLDDEPAVLGVRRGIAGKLIKLPDRRFVGG
jgi:hypothetical protein